MRTITGILCVSLVAFAAGFAGAEKGLTVRNVRYFSYPGSTRIVFEAEEAAPYVLTRSSNGRSLHFGSYGGPFALKVPQLPVIRDGVITGMELRQDGEQTGRSSLPWALRRAMPRTSCSAALIVSLWMCCAAPLPRPRRKRRPRGPWSWCSTRGTAARTIQPLVMFLAGSAINSIHDEQGLPDARLGAEAMLQAIEVHRSAELAGVPPAEHAPRLFEVARRRRLSALQTALRQRYPELSA